MTGAESEFSFMGVEPGVRSAIENKWPDKG
jgi:hypothetical protein